jgi:hypothetical protein
MYMTHILVSFIIIVHPNAAFIPNKIIFPFLLILFGRAQEEVPRYESQQHTAALCLIGQINLRTW